MNKEIPLMNSPSELAEALEAKFTEPDRALLAMNQLTTLRHGSDSVRTYATKYTRLAEATGWCQISLVHMFKVGLSDRMKDRLATESYPSTLEKFISIATRIDDCLTERSQERVLSRQSAPPRTRQTPPEPSGEQTPNSALNKLPTKEKQQVMRLINNLCTHCGSPEHQYYQYPKTPKVEKKEGGKREGPISQIRERRLEAENPNRSSLPQIHTLGAPNTPGF